MASSGTYYTLYKEQRQLVKDYADDIDDIEDIQSHLLNHLDDDQRRVNNEINDLTEDLSDAVTQNSQFRSHAGRVTSDLQRASSSDLHLSRVDDGLQDALTALRSKKSTAETKRDDYYAKYKAAKEKEVADALKAVGDAAAGLLGL